MLRDEQPIGNEKKKKRVLSLENGARNGDYGVMLTELEAVVFHPYTVVVELTKVIKISLSELPPTRRKRGELSF